MVTLGDKGPEVSKLQKLLSLIGYDLVVDGEFGNKTLRSLKAFQKKYNLVVDGIAGPVTFEALKAAQKRTSKEDGNSNSKNYGDLNIDTEHQLDSSQFLKQVFKKDKIFIHYTVSGPSPKSVIKYWDGNETRVATAFVLGGRGSEDGKIYEAHNPDYWSFHLGIKGSKGKLDRSSIGIEICAWGKLNKKGEKFFNVYGGEVPADEVYTLEDKWRGDLYYHKYSDKQLESLEKLLLWIIDEYNIPVQNIDFESKDWMEYSEDVVKNSTPGIWTHTTVRKDKQDTYPDHRLMEMLNRIKKKVNG